MLPKVMLIEDDEVIREIYGMKFELEGFTVALAENGKVALELIPKFEPDIIILDMMMPEMDGLEFMQRLKASVGLCPEIIIFSNISSPEKVKFAMKLGASDYWVKSDFTPEKVTKAVAARWRRQKNDGIIGKI